MAESFVLVGLTRRRQTPRQERTGSRRLRSQHWLAQNICIERLEFTTLELVEVDHPLLAAIRPRYVPRVADSQLQRALRTAPVVLIEGPRACGKTWTGGYAARSAVLLDAQEATALTSAMARRLLIEGAKPKLLDEYHLAPELWNPVRRAADELAQPGQFILTGSAVPPDSTTRHTGAGRVRRVRMRPMSLAESGESTAQVSLGALFDSDEAAAAAPADEPDMFELACRGGWPALIHLGGTEAQPALRDYLDDLCRADIEHADSARRDPAGVARLLESLSRNIATSASLRVLADDMAQVRPADPRTVAAYLSALERLFIVENLTPWPVDLRSRAHLVSAPKRYLVDPSLAVAALRSSRPRLLADPRGFGNLFEALVMRDLRIYADASDARLFYYRDNTGLEVDAIIERSDGRWIAVEIKLGGGTGPDKAAAALLRLRDKVDLAKTGEPAKLIVVTAGGYAHERHDGVAVVPITTLCA